MSQIKEIVKQIREKTGFVPDIGLILGSGLGDYAEKIIAPVYVEYRDLHGFPTSNVIGHKNRFVLGKCQGKNVIAMQGRFHYYEGYTQNKIALPIRIMKELGVKTLILTNAAGGVNEAFSPGDLMLISDHINFSHSNPLIGPNDEMFGPRFPDMSDVYSKPLREKIKQAAKQENICIRKGTYLMFSGPSYETPAEIKMARVLGADAVGMSTVPEAIVAAHCGMKVIGISCITNMAAGVTDKKLDHCEVVETADMAKEKFTKILDKIFEYVL